MDASIPLHPPTFLLRTNHILKPLKLIFEKNQTWPVIFAKLISASKLSMGFFLFLSLSFFFLGKTSLLRYSQFTFVHSGHGKQSSIDGAQRSVCKEGMSQHTASQW